MNPKTNDYLHLKGALNMKVNLDLLMSEKMRMEVLDRLYGLAITIGSDNLLRKEDIAVEIIEIVNDTELYLPRNIFVDENKDNSIDIKDADSLKKLLQ